MGARLDPSIYAALDSLERFQLSVAAERRGDTEELRLLQSQEPAYTARMRAFTEIANSCGWLIRGELAGYWRSRALDEDPADSLAALRAYALAWEAFCADLHVKPADSSLSTYGEALRILASHPGVTADTDLQARALSLWRGAWQERIEPADTQADLDRMMREHFGWLIPGALSHG